jgi:hypothetical protein
MGRKQCEQPGALLRRKNDLQFILRDIATGEDSHS